MGSEMESESPMDGILARIDSYIQDPSLVTKETLTELKNELIDLQGYLDEDEPAPSMQDEGEGKGGLVIAINKARSGK